MGQHDVVGRAAARAAAFQQGGVEPAAVLVGAFQVHDGIGAAVALADDAGELGKVHGIFQREGVRGGGVEPDIADVVDLLPFGGAVVVAKEALRRARLVPGPDALLLQCGRDALVDALVLQDLVGAVGLVLDEDRDRHAPGALARHHPVGLGLDHAGDAVLTGRRHPLGFADGTQRELAQRKAIDGCSALKASRRGGGRRGDRPVHGDEPLGRVAEDDGLLGAPGMRVLVLEAAARDQRIGVLQRLDDGIVGVTLVAVLLEHALALEAGGLAGEGAVGVDGEGNVRAYAALDQAGLVGHPDLEVVAAVPGRRVHEAGAVLVGDVIAVEEGDRKVIAIAEVSEWMCTRNGG